MKVMQVIPDHHQEPVLVILLFVSSQMFGFINLVLLQQIAAMLTIIVAIKTLIGNKNLNKIKNWIKSNLLWLRK